jgi:hypothetical protein
LLIGKPFGVAGFSAPAEPPSHAKKLY